MVEKDVQKRILKAILSNGGTANTREISNLTGFNIWCVNCSTKHLRSRALISRKKSEKAFPNPPYIYSLNNKLLPKIKRLISEIE